MFFVCGGVLDSGVAIPSLALFETRHGCNNHDNHKTRNHQESNTGAGKHCEIDLGLMSDIGASYPLVAVAAGGLQHTQAGHVAQVPHPCFLAGSRVQQPLLDGQLPHRLDVRGHSAKAPTVV